MIFEGKELEVLEFEGKILFNAKQVGEILDISDVNSSIRNFTEKQVVKVKNSDMHNIQFRKLNNAGENFLTESGVYKLIFKSKKEEAEKFQDWITDEVIPTIRKTGGYVANTRMFVDTYFSTMDEAGKEFLVQTLDKKLQIEQELKKAKEEIEYKSEIIEGFVEKLDIYKKRDIINRIVKSGGFGYATRYTEIYKTFKELYHIDLKARAEGYNTKVDKKKDKLSVIQYAEKFGHIDNMYNVVVKLYETEVNKILKDIYNITK